MEGGLAVGLYARLDGGKGAVKRRLGLGVDLGATRVRVCVGDSTGRILKKSSTSMPPGKSLDDYLARLVSAVKEVAREVTTGKIEGIGLASFGPLDLEKGAMANPAMPYRSVPLVKTMEDEFDLKTHLLNDANAAALGEMIHGGGRGLRHVVFVTLSTGIGSGVVLDGRLLNGKNGNAGEVGHMTVDSSGLMPCACGKRGHWEAYCSGSKIPEYARVLAMGLPKSRIAESTLGSLIARGDAFDAENVFCEAKKGDSFSLGVVHEVGKFNAIGFADVVDAYAPELIIVGGAVALNNPGMILPPIRREVPKHAVNRVPPFKLTRLGDDGGLLGALSVVFDPELIGDQ
jgi:glucokinase